MTKRAGKSAGPVVRRGKIGPAAGSAVSDDYLSVEHSDHISLITADPAQAAGYIADMLVGLQQIADKANHQFLAYLLDIAFEEATSLRSQRRRS